MGWRVEPPSWLFPWEGPRGIPWQCDFFHHNEGRGYWYAGVFFKIRNPVSSGNSKVYKTTMGPGGRGILKSPRGTGALSISGLGLVAVIPTSTGTSHGGVKGLLSIIDGDTHMGILFKGARGVVTDHKGTLNIVT